MNSLFVAPVFALVLLAFVPHLLEIAESSQEKAIDFADDMNNAIDCATRGIPIDVCSPNLVEHDFNPEIEELVQTMKDIQAETDN